MNAVEFQGNPRDLDRFALHVLKQAVTVQELSPFEHRLRWDTAGSAGVGSTMRLRSGIKLSATNIRWDQPWSFQLRETTPSLKFMMGRGAAPRMTLSNGHSYTMGGGSLQVRVGTRPINTTCAFVQGGAEFAQLALEVEPDRLRELLGASDLPRVLETLVRGSEEHGMHEQPTIPTFSRLWDEILSADTRGRSRQLFLEAKGLELLAVLMDELSLASDAMAPLSAWDIERLEHARRLLLTRMTCPPGLPELARAVGLNEFKLKVGFRMLFDSSVFGYLRTQRMEHARRLLAQRHLSITEIAAQVGYENASKFAAAFRRQFGLSPSDLR